MGIVTTFVTSASASRECIHKTVTVDNTIQPGLSTIRTIEVKSSGAISIIPIRRLLHAAA